MKTMEQFEAIVQEHYEQLFRFALSLTRSEPDAKDLTQQAFYALATKGHQLRDPARVKAWLCTTLHRAFIQLRRRQARYVDQEPDEFVEQLRDDSAAGPTALDSPQLLAALGRLDELHRAPVTLFYLENYSYQEIARVLDVPVGTIKSRLSRGLVQLKKILFSNPTAAVDAPANESVPAIQAGRRALDLEPSCAL